MPNDDGTQTVAELQAELVLIRAKIAEVRQRPTQYSIAGVQVLQQQLAVLRKEETIILSRLQRYSGARNNVARIDLSGAF